MTKRIYIAPASAGKTAFTLNLARQTAASLQAEVRVCVPTGLQARAWRARLADAGGAIGVHVLTFDRLVATCLDEASETYTELDETLLFRLLRQLINQLPLTHYEPLTRKTGFVQVVHQLIIELKSSLINPQEFTAAVSQLGDEPRLSELAVIYAAYQKQLRGQKWADRVGLHWLAVEALQQRRPDACGGWAMLIVDGFDDFTPSQLGLFSLLADRVGSCIVTLPHSERVRYPRYERTRRMVEIALGVKAEPLPQDAATSKTTVALCQLGQRLFTGSAEAPIEVGDALTMVEAPDPAAEVRAALRWLKQQIVQNNRSPDQLALLARRMPAYRPFIQQIADEFGLPVFLSEGLPLQNSPIIEALLALLRLYLPIGPKREAELPRRQVVNCWRSPYFAWGAEEEAITAADAERLDQFARRGRIIQGEQQWQSAFRLMAHAADQESSLREEEDALFDKDTVLKLRDKFAFFLARSRPPQHGTMRDFVRWLEEIIGPDPQVDAAKNSTQSLQMVAQARRHSGTVDADIAALRCLKEVLRGLVWADDAVGIDKFIDFATFFGELSGAIVGSRFMPAVPANQPSILAADVTQVRGLSFAAAALMGLSEGIFPTTISEDAFLRDKDRRILNEQHNFSLKSSTESAEREFFYEAVTRARDALLVTRPVLADGGAAWVASPFWDAVQRVAAVTPQTVSSETAVPAANAASPSEWWDAVAAASDTSPAWQNDPTWQQIRHAARVWRARERGKAAPWNGDLAPLAVRLQAQFGPEHLWSSSQLELYRACGLHFFVTKVLNVRPRQEPIEGMDARQLGQLYHDIFEKLMQNELPEREETAVHNWVKSIADPILDAAPERLGFRKTAWWRQTRIEIIDTIVQSVLAFPNDGYSFYRAEVSFGDEKPPLVIWRDGDAIRLKGFIDRIDRRADGTLRIVDYKTSGKSSYTTRSFERGELLQLPLYALAAQEALELGRVSDGFYWHFLSAEKSAFTLQKVENQVEGAIETAVAHAWDAVDRIRSGRFAPTPPDGGCPSYCPAAAFCWQYTPRFNR